jgi:hypothetical protein
MTGTTVAKWIMEEFNRHKETVIKKLKSSRGKSTSPSMVRGPATVRMCRVLWPSVTRTTSPRRLYSELEGQHTGVNIAEEVNDILESFQIQDKVGYSVLDNTYNDTVMEQLGDDLEFDGIGRRVRRIGHIINWAAKALLLGNDSNCKIVDKMGMEHK